MHDIIEVMTYDQWEAIHRQKQQAEVRKRRKYIARLRKYYLHQRLYGLAIVLFGVVVAVIGNLMLWGNLIGLGGCMAAVGLYIAVTRRMILADGYFCGKK